MAVPVIGWGGRPWNAETAKTANYSVLLADSGTLFTTVGNGGALTFTLPALLAGMAFVAWFWNTVDQNMIITAPTGKLVMDGNSGAASCCYTTASHRIGSFCMVVLADSGANYYLFNLGGTAPTSA